ncbi:MAG: cytochrome c [Pseudomonadota bacterium]|nr:cytochrome c [Pseudomonadota bacterium]
MKAWRVPGALLLLLGLCLASAAVQADPLLTAGEAIYRGGVLRSGAPLDGVRKDSGQGVQGDAAACVHCHRNSGLGSQEGLYSIPPVSARYLYHPRAAHAEHQDLPYVAGEHPDREPYTDVTLARAIREGVDSEGRPLGYLMPRFALSDDDMVALIAYLKTLAPAQVPGVTPTLLHFATIVTPDADPVKRRAMLDVLERFFAEKNSFPWGPTPSMQTSGRTAQIKSMYMANRHWQLHVWQLDGAPADWPAQLQRHFAEEPVMAVISGLGGTDWTPVHAFCQRAHLPCLFPNLEVPVDVDRDFYSLYFSRGVLLESQLIAQRLGDTAGDVADAPVQQVYRSGDSGEAGAHALALALQGFGRSVQDVPIPAGPAGSGVREALQRAAGRGPLVLWLRPDDLSALAGTPAPLRPVFASGIMGGLEHAPVPAEWRQRLLMAYPFDLPERRVVRVDYPLGWFRIRRIPVVAEQVQVDTYLACGLLSEALNHMADNFVPEYLVERIEELVGHRILTGYYPRLSLTQGQRFASKGGYLVQLPVAASGRLTAMGDWVVP